MMSVHLSRLKVKEDKCECARKSIRYAYVCVCVCADEFDRFILYLCVCVCTIYYPSVARGCRKTLCVFTSTDDLKLSLQQLFNAERSRLDGGVARCCLLQMNFNYTKCAIALSSSSINSALN
jgi:hypothetical protein